MGCQEMCGSFGRVLTVWEAESPYPKNATSKLNLKHWTLWDRGRRLQSTTPKNVKQ